MENFLVGTILILVSVGSVIVCRPRNGKFAWFVGKPFLEPFVPVMQVAAFGIGLILMVAHFTTFGDATLTGLSTASN